MKKGERERDRDKGKSASVQIIEKIECDIRYTRSSFFLSFLSHFIYFYFFGFFLSFWGHLIRILFNGEYKSFPQAQFYTIVLISIK